MSDSIPSIGIDFGTTNSSMAWFNPRTSAAEVILNAEGEAKTPSLVYFGENETLVGKLVDELIEDVSADRGRREEIFRRTVASIKRNLLSPPRIALPGGRFVRPVDVAAEILKKLKRDAEEGHFHQEVARTVITCPAEFNVLQRRKIEEAGHLAGFSEVELIEEPVAGALSYARAGLDVGHHVLVYDLGGGTFDLAVLENEDESFHVAMEPKGMERCGGDDFDYALYYHCDELARESLGRPISLVGNTDLKFLRLCRRRKENLSWQERSRFGSYLASEDGPVHFEHEVDRGTFEELIDPYIEETVRLTEAILEQARARGHEVDTIVLIGGSSRVPLVDRTVKDTLPVEPLKFDKKDVAVALGAAYYANIRWRSKPGSTPPPPPPEPTPQDKYREAVQAVSSKRLDRGRIDQLDAVASQLSLSKEQMSEIEYQVLGATIEETFRRQLGEYREAVEGAWKGGKLGRAEADRLGALAKDLGLEEEAAGIEREVLGATRDEILPRQYREAVRAAWDRLDVLAGELGLSREQAVGVELKVLSETGRLNLEEARLAREEHKVAKAKGADRNTGRGARELKGRSEKVSAREERNADLSRVKGTGRSSAGRGARKPKGQSEKVSQVRFTLARTLTGHSKAVRVVAVSPDGQLLASSSMGSIVNVWNVRTGRPTRELAKHSWGVHSIAFSPDGTLLASGDGGGATRLWRPRTGELIYTLTGQLGGIRFIAFSPEGRLLANGDGKRVGLWDLQTGELLRTFSKVSSMTFSPNGGLLIGSQSGDIKLWEAETGKLLHTLDGHSGVADPVVISPDGRTLASGGSKIKAWNLEAGSLLRMLDSNSRVRSIAMSADGQLLFGGGDDGKIKVWNLETGELLDNLSGHSKGVNSVAVSPDGCFLVSGGEDKTVRIWERAQDER